MAVPATTPFTDNSPERLRAVGEPTIDSSQAPDGRFFDGPDPAEQPPRRELFPGVIPLAAWGLVYLENPKGGIGKLYHGKHLIPAYKPGIITLLRLLSDAEGKPVEFTRIVESGKFGQAGDRSSVKINAVKAATEDLKRLFDSQKLPYFHDFVVDKRDPETGELEPDRYYLQLRQSWFGNPGDTKD